MYPITDGAVVSNNGGSQVGGGAYLDGPATPTDDQGGAKIIDNDEPKAAAASAATEGWVTIEGGAQVTATRRRSMAGGVHMYGVVAGLTVTGQARSFRTTRRQIWAVASMP
ncbi:MAG: hypothetical protein IPK19_20710 [Chloroflexi bacterium]|nr:hypothetical protein [Chloroflexota bacterium]